MDLYQIFISSSLCDFILTSCATLPPGDMNSSLDSVRLQSIHESRVGVGTGELVGLMWGDESDGSVSYTLHGRDII